jgi:transposase
LVQDLADHGVKMSPGTLAGGLQALAPVFAPIEEALKTQLRRDTHWHADETRWAVFIDVEGQVGHRWYLWVFHSSSVVHYVLDKTRAAHVVTAELAGVTQGILSCDRYSAYKKFARLNPGIVLAFCWAHQRRDFLELAHAYPASAPWALEWVDAIGRLYHLNDVRLRTTAGSAERRVTHAALEQAVQRMAETREAALANPLLRAPAAAVLTSMQGHWSGLTVCVRCPWVPMDNNPAERDIRGPVVGRKNFSGSGAQWSGQLAATLYSVMATLTLHRINARTWLTAYLQACADKGGHAPRDLRVFLPWTMDAARLAAMRANPSGAGAGRGEALNRS